ncbi:MAG: YdcF family protein [Bernardetiaceae bacterium]|nr:YdcF family protein [Bernardetiaceae bacterium]
MFFILSKTLDFLLMPITWLMIGLALIFWLKSIKWKRRITAVIFFLMLLLSNRIIINELALKWEIEPQKFQDIHKTYDIGILLTGVIEPNKSPHDRVHLQKGADRITHAVQLYKEGKIRKILVTGAPIIYMSGEVENGDNDYYILLQLLGVPKDDIILEEQARNTSENAQFTKELLTKRFTQYKPSLILITSAFHMRRARACFEKEGLYCDVFSTDFYSIDSIYNGKHFLPSVYAFYLWHKFIREWAGYSIYALTGKI